MQNHAGAFVNCSRNFKPTQQKGPTEKEEDSTRTENASSLPVALLASIGESIVPILFNASSQKTDKGCLWTNWSEWSSCSITCGDNPGQRARSRSQRGSRRCLRHEAETKDCFVNKCPVHCTWSLWTPWSTCSQSCGTGFRTRTRSVTIEPAYGGKTCLPSGGQEQEPCVVGSCPVNGQWSDWSRWGYCSATCGNGTRNRQRDCNKPMPENGGFPCAGQSIEVGSCSGVLKPCQPLHGGWSDWSRWGGCNKKCGRGATTRTRSCSNPTPQHGGRVCKGQASQSRACFLNRCSLTGPVATMGIEPTTLRPLLRVGSRTTSSTTEMPVTDELDIDEQTCTDAPYILGFNGPFLSKNTSKEVKHMGVPVGQSAVYFCSGGRVLDVFTNRRFYSLGCIKKDNDSFVTFKFPQQWPLCKQPTHCVGPARKPQKGDPIYLPIPRRDAPINSQVEYICKNQHSKSLFATCFVDGNYRYPNRFSCTETSSDVVDVCDVESEEQQQEIQSEGISVNQQSTGRRPQHGWFQSAQFPDYVKKAQDCKWTVVVEPGFSVHIGLEKLAVVNATLAHCATLVATDSITGEPLHTWNTKVKYDNGWTARRDFHLQTMWTCANSIRHPLKFRVNYLVVEP